MKNYTLAYLQSLPTLCVGQSCDLKIDNSKNRIWLSRCTVADGEPYDNKVTVESCIAPDGTVTRTWAVVRSYPAK